MDVKFHFCNGNPGPPIGEHTFALGMAPGLLRLVGANLTLLIAVTACVAAGVTPSPRGLHMHSASSVLTMLVSVCDRHPVLRNVMCV